MKTIGKGEGGREDEEGDNKFPESRRLNKNKNDKTKKTKIERRGDGEKKVKVVGRMGERKGTVIRQSYTFVCKK
jgi:hypothetical protein